MWSTSQTWSISVLGKGVFGQNVCFPASPAGTRVLERLWWMPAMFINQKSGNNSFFEPLLINQLASAQFYFLSVEFPVKMKIKLREPDYGSSSNLSDLIRVISTTLDMQVFNWGIEKKEMFRTEDSKSHESLKKMNKATIMCEPLFQRAQRNRGWFLCLHVYSKRASAAFVDRAFSVIVTEQPCYLETFWKEERRNSHQVNHYDLRGHDLTEEVMASCTCSIQSTLARVSTHKHSRRFHISVLLWKS